MWYVCFFRKGFVREVRFERDRGVSTVGIVARGGQIRPETFTFPSRKATFYVLLLFFQRVRTERVLLTMFFFLPLCFGVHHEGSCMDLGNCVIVFYNIPVVSIRNRM